jgi:hypothetical protein
MKKMSNQNMLQITGGEENNNCMAAGFVSVFGIAGITAGVIIAGGPSAYWSCITAAAPKEK